VTALLGSAAGARSGGGAGWRRAGGSTAAAWRGRPAARVGGGGVSVRVCVSSVWRACVCVETAGLSPGTTLFAECRIGFAECRSGALNKAILKKNILFTLCRVPDRQALGKQIFANSILTCKPQKNKIQIKNKHYFMHNNFKLKLR